jgi:ComF family protein
MKDITGKTLEALMHLFFANLCAGCDQPLSRGEKMVCLRCLFELPETGFHLLEANPVEQLFTGRIPVSAATACYFFHKNVSLQHIIHQFKYHNRKEAAVFMGALMGNMLKQSVQYAYIDGIIPVPLHSKKQMLRGYNQSELLSEGIAGVLQAPVIKNGLVRMTATESQTKKSRLDRWQNVKDAFQIVKPAALKGKHLLLVDDVITTGATIEACAEALLHIPGVKVSIAALAKADY